MIYLPKNSTSKFKILFPVPKTEWLPPSQSQPRDAFGNENRTFFRLRAILDDGFVKWTGWFEDREDFDAFLWALITKTVHMQPALWDMCVPSWSPYIGENIAYDFATVTFYTSSPGTTQTWNRPLDWNPLNNTIECIGGGGSGGARYGNFNIGCTGGGGGAYSKIVNFDAASASYQIGSGGAGRVQAVSGGGVGNSGSSTWFNSTTDPGNGSDNTKVGAAGGGAGGDGLSAASVSGGIGGPTTSSWGSTKFSGGSGGNITISTVSGNFMTGGGGAAGSTSSGGNGVDITTSTTPQQSNGGVGGTINGGVAGTTPGGIGGNGFLWQLNYGAGGGGAGRTNGTPGGNGGNYGAGGGAVSGGIASTISGSGSQGILVITYASTSPISSSIGIRFNMLILG